MAHKLLLADDSVTIQRVIELTFADEDVQVIAVGDGKKAIASIQADRPDIVLADVGMPERDGYEVAAFIKGTAEFSHIPVLLLTGAFEPIDETRARAVGCDGVLVKPFEPQMVISRVKDLLAGRKPVGLWAASPAAQTPLRQPAPPAPDPNQATAAAGGSLEDYFDRLDAAFASLDGPPGAPAAPLPPPARLPVDFTPAASHEAPPQTQAPPRQAPAAAYSPLDDLGGWDPDLAGDPKKPAPFERAVIEIDPPRGYAPVSAPAVTPAPPPYAAPPAPAPTPPPAAVAHAPAPPPAAVAHAPAPAARVHGAPMPSLAEAFATLLSAEQGVRIAPSGMGAPLVTDEMVDEIVRRVIARMADQAVRETVLDVAERLVREEIERIKRG
jgi:CheY-like chemotaxis protein